MLLVTCSDPGIVAGQQEDTPNSHMRELDLTEGEYNVFFTDPVYTKTQWY